MNEYFIYILLFVIALVLGAIAGSVFSNLKNKGNSSKLEEQNNQLKLQIEDHKIQYNNQVESLKNINSEAKQETEKLVQKIEEERENIRREKDLLSTELTRKNADFENLQLKNKEQKEEVEKLQEKFEITFENLAQKIFDQKSEKFTTLNKDNIKNILEPLQEKIQVFEKRIADGQKESIDRHASLRQQILGLKELNEQMSKEANNLTKALKGDTKMQGNWGEMVLERVLERSGLQKDSEYFVQQSFNTEEGKRVMPDVVIHMPGNKKMIVDSKVSLNAYERYCNETDDNERNTHLKNHLISVRRRVDELSQKNYHALYQMESPDFVLLFIPIEAAFAVASNQYPNLYTDAFDKNIIIVTPTTLLAVLKTIDSMWQNEKQKQNAIDIATQAGALYDQFTNLTDELLKVGRQIGTVQNSYEIAMKKLTGKGNLIKRVEKLKKLGAKASKQLDQKLIARAENNDGEDDDEEETLTLKQPSK